MRTLTVPSATCFEDGLHALHSLKAQVAHRSQWKLAACWAPLALICCSREEFDML